MSDQPSKERVVVISPTAGLGNRLRAMCAAAVIAKRMKAKLVHCWDGGRYDCGNHSRLPRTQNYHDRGFEFFFQPDPIPRYDPAVHEKPSIAFTEWLDPHNIWTPIRDYGRRTIQPQHSLQQDKLFASPKLPKCSVLIETSLPFSKANDVELSQTYQTLFKPQQRFAELVPTLPSNTTALHVRRGDFLWYFGNANVADDILIRYVSSFEEPVLIFSDDVGLKAKLDAAVRVKPNVTLPSEGLSDEEIAFVEFLTMASAAQVIGTEGSSFSKEAALFGAKPYYVLNEMVKSCL
jgi:hypothetical protein